MRKLMFLFFLFAAVLPMHAAQQVTVNQLEQTLAAAYGKHDQDLAKQLGGMELTERLSSPRFTKLLAGLPGEKSCLAFLALADASAFLKLPAAEIPAAAPPDIDTQGHILARAVEHVATSIHRLPNFFARKTTHRFHDLKVSYLNPGALPVIVERQAFQPIDSFSDTVYYRNGQEVVETAEKQAKTETDRQYGLVNWGVFGPLLSLVVTDIYEGRLEWGHWEERATGRVAVFDYFIPKERSSYAVKYCCVGSMEKGWHTFESTPAYHGEIAIDPDTGTVYRLVLVTELSPFDPIFRDEVMVEYEEVEIGGKMYNCPRKSVAITTVIDQIVHVYDGCSPPDCPPAHVDSPNDTYINDTAYDSYHLFRSESRILPDGVTSQENESHPGSSPTSPPATRGP